MRDRSGRCMMSVLSDLRTVLVHQDFRKLFAVRLVSQCGDGMFQIGLATFAFFNPQSAPTAALVAAAFATLLLPFTIVAPFAGPLLDRWRRRQVLLLGNAVRVVLTIALAVVTMTQGWGAPVIVLALVTLGINRFLLAALSAGLPRVVPREQLLIANTLTPTLGAVSAATGAGIGLLIGAVAPDGALHDGLALIAAALLFGCASALALRLGKDRLGPESAATGRGRSWAEIGGDLRSTVADMVDGARYLVRRRTPGMALGVMALHRFLYGVNFIALILISRNLLTDPADAKAGLATFGLLVGISFAGNGLAILLTPLAHERMRPSTWILVCLGVGATSQGLLALTPARPMVMISAFLLGLSVQGAKIAVDTIVQRDTDDAYRGRAFSLYDMLYNVAFVGAAALAATVLPDTGWASMVFGVLGLVYIAVGIAYRTGTRAIDDTPAPVGPATAPTP